VHKKNVNLMDYLDICNLCGDSYDLDELVYRPDIFGIDQCEDEDGNLIRNCEVCIKCEKLFDQKS
jgi:hypothetical protein